MASRKPSKARQGLPGIPAPLGPQDRTGQGLEEAGDTFGEQWFCAPAGSPAFEQGHTIPSWAEPVTEIRPQSNRGVEGWTKERWGQLSIVTADRKGRCSGPVRSLPEAGGGVRGEGTPSRHWGKGTPRAGGSTRAMGAAGHQPSRPHTTVGEPRGRQLEARPSWPIAGASFG